VTLQGPYDPMTGGTGLGLGITRRLVQALGGEIGVKSIAAQGSVFWVRLPFVTAVDAQDAPIQDPVEILVVDDNQINRFVLRSLLEETGHRVSEAANGQAGVDMAAETRFDLILMDISMPGMDGIEAARQIRSGVGASRGARMAAVTAHAHAQDRSRLAEAGMPDCLVKPITRSALASLLAGTRVSGHPKKGASPLVDTELLADLTERIAPGHVSDLLGRFIAEGDATIDRLRSGVTPTEAVALVHRLGGAAATFGAAELAQYLRETEDDAANGALPAKKVEAVADSWARTRAALLPQHRAAE
jgi:CheY-like chemotaxis protein